MTQRSQFVGFGVQIELKDGKTVKGKIAKATPKGLTLNDVTFSDGTAYNTFKVRSTRLKDLKVLTVPPRSTSFKKNKNTKYSNDRSRRDNWQNEDVDKIKSGAAFDFQSNLTMFNKRDVFAQLKQMDTVDPSQRLVAFNTGKSTRDTAETSNRNDKQRNNLNYEPDELVIPNAKDDDWNKLSAEFDTISGQSTDDSDVPSRDVSQRSSSVKSSNHDTMTDGEQGRIDSGEENPEEEGVYGFDEEGYDNSGEQNYLPVTKSINITRLLESAVNDADGDSNYGSKKLAAGKKNQKQQKQGSNRNKNGNSGGINDRKGVVGKRRDEGSDNSDIIDDDDDDLYLRAKLEKMILSQTISRSNSYSANPPTLRNRKNHQLIPMATPVELLEIERLTNETFKISTDTMNEVFANNASYLIRKHLGGSSRLTIKNQNPEPLIVILVSDMNRSGTKALSLARYLCQLKQVRVIILFACPSSEIQDKLCLQKIDTFKKSGGKVVNSLKNLKLLVSKLNSPIEMIIDAMQGFDSNLSDFDEVKNSRSKIAEIIDWCNDIASSGNVRIWSIDIPSGYDSSSGLENFETAVTRVDKILCSYSWPLSCLKNMRPVIGYDSSDEDVDDETVVLIDCGIPKSVYAQKNSLRKFSTVDTFVVSGAIPLSL